MNREKTEIQYEALDRIRMQVSSDARHVRSVRDFIYRTGIHFGLTPSRAYDLKIVIGEALNNIIRHAYRDEPGKPILIEAVKYENFMEVTLRDYGVQAPVVSGHSLDISEYRESGIGVYLISRLSDYHFFDQSQEHGTKLVIKMRIEKSV